jgi:hypothetical protein
MKHRINFSGFLIWVLLFALIYVMAYLRPIHQDDGWYASFALRYLNRLGLIENASFYSFQDTLEGNDISGGFLFPGLQTLVMSIFGFSVAAVRVLNAIAITGIIYFVYLFAAWQIPKYKWFITALFALNPVFYYHFYNRPEIIAAFLVLVSTYLLLTRGNSNRSIFYAFLIWGFVLDSHPIAIFCLPGIGLWFWLKNKSKSLYIIGGGLTGLAFMLILNQLINGNLGLFAGLVGQLPMNFGDHYVPLFKSDLKDFLRITQERIGTLFYFTIFSGLFVLITILLYRKQAKTMVSHPIVLNYFVFLLLSTLGTEATSNGFALYSIVMIFLVYIVAIKVFVDSGQNRFGWYIFAPLLLFSLAATCNKIIKNFNYQLHFEKSARNFGNCIRDNTNVLMRPTFVFSTYDNVMIKEKLDFKSALIFKKYDYIIIDENNLKYEFSKDLRDNESFKNPAYEKYIGIGFNSSEFEKWKKEGFLKEVCSFDEISHGNSILYKVHR